MGADVPTVDTSSPVGLFKSVCLADEVRLPASRFRAERFAKLPDGIKAVIGFSLQLLTPEAVTPLTPIGEADVPNSLFVLLPDKDTFLLLPAPGEQGRVAEHCAVIWRGNHYSDALAAVHETFDTEDFLGELPPTRGLTGINYFAVQADGRIVGAAEFNGWTMLRIAPDTSSDEQAVQ